MSETEPILQAWRLVDPDLLRRHRPAAPDLLLRTDGKGILYRGQLNALVGEPESGKSWLAILACVEEMEAGRHVFYFDFEADADSMMQRLEALGVDPDMRREFFHYADQTLLNEPLTQGIWTSMLDPQIKEHEPSLVVLDAVTEAMFLQGLDTKDDAGAAAFYGLLVKGWLAYGITVIQIDHIPKNSHNKGFAFGSQHKKAMVKGAQLLVSFYSDKQRFGVGRGGKLDIEIQKDNAGHLRGMVGVGAKLAQAVATPTGDTGLIFEILPMKQGAEAKEESIAQKEADVLAYLAEHSDQDFSPTDLKTLVSGANDKILQAISNLRTEGRVTVTGTDTRPRISHLAAEDPGEM